MCVCVFHTFLLLSYNCNISQTLRNKWLLLPHPAVNVNILKNYRKGLFHNIYFFIICCILPCSCSSFDSIRFAYGRLLNTTQMAVNILLLLGRLLHSLDSLLLFFSSFFSSTVTNQSTLGSILPQKNVRPSVSHYLVCWFYLIIICLNCFSVNLTLQSFVDFLFALLSKFLSKLCL